MDYLRQMVHSVITQTYRVKLFLHGDGVGAEINEQVVAMVDGLCDEYDKAIWLTDIDFDWTGEHKGRPYSINRVMSRVRTDYAGLLDSDDMLNDGMSMEVMANELAASDPDICYSDRLCMCHDEILDTIVCARPPANYTWEAALTGAYPFHLCLWKKTLFDQVNGCEPCLSHAVDYNLLIKMLEHNPKMAHVEAPLYLYRLHDYQMGENREMQQACTLMGVIKSLQRKRPDARVKVNWEIFMAHLGPKN
jgi:O-antigen biosynthesis protein